MAINSKVQICNMSNSHLGNYGSIMDIDTPKSTSEIVYSLWYDIARQTFLKMVIPNFSMARKTIASVNETSPFPFTYSYEYPSDCLKILGIGAVEDKINNYTVEGNRIYTNVYYADGMPIRYIKDIKDVSLMSPEFKIAFSWYLASLVALEITQDINKSNYIESILPEKMATLSSLNAQENMPIRISRSKFKQARYNGNPYTADKR